MEGKKRQACEEYFITHTNKQKSYSLHRAFAWRNQSLMTFSMSLFVELPKDGFLLTAPIKREEE